MVSKWVKSNILDIIQILPWMVPIVIGLLAFLQNTPWYIIVLVIIIAFAVIFLGINQYSQWRTMHKKRLTKSSDQEIEQTIRDWLDDPYFTFQRSVNQQHLFQFIVKDPIGRPITITRTKEDATQLYINTSITLLDKDRARYEALNPSEKQKIMLCIRIEMSRYGISYSGINENLTQVILSDMVLIDDSMTGFNLKQRIFFVIRAFALYSDVIDQQLTILGK